MIPVHIHKCFLFPDIHVAHMLAGQVDTQKHPAYLKVRFQSNCVNALTIHVSHQVISFYLQTVSFKSWRENRHQLWTSTPRKYTQQNLEERESLDFNMDQVLWTI